LKEKGERDVKDGDRPGGGDLRGDRVPEEGGEGESKERNY